MPPETQYCCILFVIAAHYKSFASEIHVKLNFTVHYATILEYYSRSPWITLLERYYILNIHMRGLRDKTEKKPWGILQSSCAICSNIRNIRKIMEIEFIHFKDSERKEVNNEHSF